MNGGLVGTTLKHYRIVRFLGSGGMGEVYAAEDGKLHRMVALKILPAATADDPERLARFQREAQAIAALNHPNVVTIYSVEEAGGHHFLTMEIVEGKTLGELNPPGGLPLDKLLDVAVPLVDALHAAHEKGVVHRDLKPTNVMVGASGRLKVLDFGLARLRQEALGGGTSASITDRLTASNQVFGTPGYMSPEQIEGRAIDRRTDIFSFGIVLYELATGARPFQGDTSLAIVSSILKETPAPLASIRPDLPPDLDRIVRRCLAKEPERRYQTALDLRNELKDLRQLHVSDAQVARSAERVRSPRQPWTIAAVACIAVAAFAGYALLSRTDRRDAGPLRASFSQLTQTPGIEWFPSLSPDSQWVVYAGDATGNRDIYMQSATGQTAINLTRDSTADDDQPAFAPDGERIAFRSTRDGGGIFVMGRAGEGVRRLTRIGYSPAWSPDGAQIAFATHRMDLRPQNSEGRSELWVVGMDGADPRRVYEGDATMPNWSPHGHRIAFGQRLGAHPSVDVLTVAAAGGEAVHVTKDAAADWNPVWAPDGRHLYFVSDRGGSTNLWRIAIDEATGLPGNQPEPITSPSPFAAHLSISADGRRLAYSAVDETQNIYKLPLDPATGDALGEPVPVTKGTRFWSSPDPSPDGAWVVFYSQVNTEGDLYIARADGSGEGLRQLTADEAIDRVPRWSPDGKWIAMFSDRARRNSEGTRRNEVWRIGIDGSDLRQVTTAGGGVVAWAPDSSHLAVTGSERGAIIIDAHRSEQTPTQLPAPLPSDPRFVPNSWSWDGRWIVGQSWYTVLGVVVYSVEQRTYQRVTDFGEWPVWLPDNRRVLVVSGITADTRGREFHVIDTHTKASKRIYSVRRGTLGPPRVTRDGGAAFFSRRATEADIWLVNLQ